MAGLNSSPRLAVPSSSKGKLLTVLSIDGGGIKGLIPAVVLEFLEAELKKLDGEEARIADYFDVVAGTSTGGLIATMLGAPDANANNPRPKFTTQHIRNFYVNDGDKIFPPNTAMPIYGPKYSNDFLKETLEAELGTTKLVEALTNLVIPSFDILHLTPVIFSKYKAQEDEFKYLNQLLSDISLSTSAAPTLLPAYDKFKSENGDTEFNMIDGGAAAGNPVLVALSELGQEKMKHPELYPMMDQADDCSNILLLSLGCGVLRSTTAGWTVETVNAWSRKQWLVDQPPEKDAIRLPMLEILGVGALEIVDYYAYSLFKARKAQSNYLRVQTDALTPEMGQMDNATPVNLYNLANCAKDMILGKVKRINPVTYKLEPIDDITTYKDELIRFAKILSDERKNRLTL